MKKPNAIKGKKKKYGVCWYMPKSDEIVELEADTGYALIIMLMQWNPMFDRDEWMLLGVI